MEQNKTENEESLETLESPSTQPSLGNENQNLGGVAPQPGQPSSTEGPPKKHVRRGIEKLSELNIYLLGFILVIVIAGIVAFLGFNKSQHEDAKKESLITEPLSQTTLDQLKQTDVRVGDPKQILSVESNAIFAGKVLIRDSAEIAGKLKVGGPLELTGLTVSGPAIFDALQAKSLDISGNGNINGQLVVGQGLNVGGNLSVAGSLTAKQLDIGKLQVSGDLNLARHIDAGGATPGRSNGNALGSGGSSSVSGTDTAGTVNVNTGGSPHAGCFANLTFNQAYGATPHVVITPVGSTAASVRYYVNRSGSGFSVCSASTPPAGRNFAFDYVVID